MDEEIRPLGRSTATELVFKACFSLGAKLSRNNTLHEFCRNFDSLKDKSTSPYKYQGPKNYWGIRSQQINLFSYFFLFFVFYLLNTTFSSQCIVLFSIHGVRGCPSFSTKSMAHHSCSFLKWYVPRGVLSVFASNILKSARLRIDPRAVLMILIRFECINSLDVGLDLCQQHQGQPVADPRLKITYGELSTANFFTKLLYRIYKV